MSKVSQSEFPNFLCIGTQKAGITWLSANLAKHPDIWLPKRNELHFLDRKFPIDMLKTERHLALEAAKKGSKKSWQKKWEKLKKKYDWETLLWETRYRLAKGDESWYAGLFDNAQGRITGDLTPSYVLLGEEAIKYMHSHRPNTKIILLMREPIDRAWSHAKMDIVTHAGRSIDAVSDEEFKAHFNLPSAIARSDYVDIHKRWKSVFSEHQVLCIYSDDIREHPNEVMEVAYEFLGADKTFRVEGASKVVHGGTKSSLPEYYWPMLYEVYRPIIERQAEYFGGRAEQWYKKITDLNGQINS